MRILLVEDDAVLREVMARSLRDAGHRVDEAACADEAAHWWRVQPCDAVLLDLSLPDLAGGPVQAASGLRVLRQARRMGDATPVLVLTARNRTEERIAGLDAGADDYLGKPFDLDEVEARLRALVRRAQGVADQATLGRLTLDRKARRFTVGDEALDLPAREFEVLWELMTPPGHAVSKRALSDKLSSFDEALGDNALEAFISRLRKKLTGSGASIRTLRGIGYLTEPELEPPNTEAPATLPTLRARVLRHVVWPLGLVWCLGTTFMLGLASHFTEAAFDRALLDDAYAIASHVRAAPGGEVALRLSTNELKAALFDHVESVHFAVFDAQGQRLAGEALPAMTVAPGQNFRYSEYEFMNQPVRAVALRHVVDQKTYTVVMAHTTRARGELESRLLFFAALPQLLLLGLLVLWLRRSIDQDLEPLSQLQNTLARRDVHDLSGVTVSASTQDIEQLGRTVSQLFERLERGARAQREFAGNVAHELRTPLAGIRALTEYGLAQDDPTVYRQQLAQVHRSVGRASRLVDQLLGLALASEGELALQPRRLQPTRLLREAVLRHLGRADAQGVDLGARGLDEATLESLAILADPALVEAMLDNLIDNALRYGGRTLTLALSLSTDGRHCTLAVIDDGPGIAAPERQALTQRWRQGGAGQRLGQGAGLGLSIVARFAELSGAEFMLADAQPHQGGLKASLRFPVA